MQENPRLRALYLLMEVLDKRRPLKEVIQPYYEGLEQRDKAFLQELLYGVLRRLFYLDWIIKQYLQRPKKLNTKSMNNLRLGCYQVLYMRVPDWAAVNETVKVEKMTGRNPKLVNAVLRKITEKTEVPPLPTDPIEKLSIITSHPQWLIRRWVKRFGVSETEKLLNMNNTIAPLTVRINAMKTSRELLLKKMKRRGLNCKTTKYSPFGITVLNKYRFIDIKEFAEEAMVQDEAAQLVTLLLEPEKGERILDCCAAPGGKTSFIAEIVEEDADIVAVDISRERVKMLKENLSMLGHNSVSIIQADVRSLIFREGFHKIMVDAPCSSLGVIRRNPDVRYRHTEDDLRRFKEIQLALLLSASKHLIKGGVLLYCVCSFEPEETYQVVEVFLNKRKDFFIIKDMIPKNIKPFMDRRGFFITFPHRNQMDGFFGVRFIRK